MKTCFTNVNLIDGTGKEILKGATLTTKNGVIEEIGIGKSCSCTEECNVVDLENKYVMPGMIDAHVHMFSDSDPDLFGKMVKYNEVDFIIMAIKNLERQLKSGVTFIRDAGGIKHYGIKLKKYLQDGTIKGPDVYCAGKIITMTGGHGHIMGREADGPDEVRKAVREQLKAGADVVKVISSGGVLTPGVDVNAYQFNVDELSAAVEEAHKAGRKVMTHCHSTQGIKNSVLAGIDSIEHTTLLDEEGAGMMAEAGTYMVPTLAAVHFIVVNGEEGGIPKSVVDKAKEVYEQHQESFKYALDYKLNIAMGTDAGTPFNLHGNSAFELFLMTKAGMSPMEAIVTSTKNSSELIGIDKQYGTLEVGKFANLIVLDENPLDNIETIQNPVAVYKKGNLV